MSAMQFWGIEVKGKEPSKVKLEEGHVIHLSQAALGEQKKDREPVILHVNVDGKKLVLGILSSENNPQLSFDLVFEKDFEISHNWKNGSVHLLGYQSEMPEEGDEFDFSDSDEDEDVPVPVTLKENGETPAPAAVKKAVAAKPNKDNKPKPPAKAEEEDDDGDDDDDSDDDDSDEDMADISDDSDDDLEGSEDDDEESSEEETPAKVAESGKKRKVEAKTPEPKKAKVATPQKTDGKKCGHTATPHPAKKGGKTPAGGDKSTPKSGGSVSCDTCKKTFNSEVGLQSHTKAKHSGK